MFSKTLITFLLIMLSTGGQAELFDRGGGMIYDDALDITWLQDANLGGSMNWDDSVAWADALVYGGYDDWRLPALRNDNIVVCSIVPEPECRDDELGYMYYYNLGGTSAVDLTGNQGLFTNIQSTHWTGTSFQYPGSTVTAYCYYYFIFNDAGCGTDNSNKGAWAVRDGDVGVSNNEATLLVVGGQLVGAEDVLVDGGIYDVAFVDGTCIDLFDGCDDVSDFTFQGYPAALAASQALMEQVFLDSPEGMFDSVPGLTTGCEDPDVCRALTPHGMGATPAIILTGAASNSADGLLDDATITNSIGRASDTSLGSRAVFAVWERAYVAPVMAIGSGTYAGGGYVEILDPANGFAHAAWPRVDWTDYNGASGDTRVAWCDVDGDGSQELVIGLGSMPSNGGWVEIKDDAAANYAHLAWLRVQWIDYNAANGETWPACGDLDGDGRDEIVLGLGAGGYGWMQVFDDAASGYNLMAGTPAATGWLETGWGYYNNEVNAGVRPAVGQLDGDPNEEILLALGPGSSGWVQILDDAGNGFLPLAGTPPGGGWLQLDWAEYAASNGETWPAVCDLNGDGGGEVVLGVGTGGNGWAQVVDSQAGFAPASGTAFGGGWVRLSWDAYASAVGAVFPACGNLDSDNSEELVFGLGSYPSAGGWVELRDDLGNSLQSTGWTQYQWPLYNMANGLTRPAISD